MSDSSNRCTECDQQLPSAVLGGLCPTCLLKAALGNPVVAAEEAQSSVAESNMPTVELSTKKGHDESCQIIGRYKLLQELGEGGFGIVYLAQQSEPVKRRVALKVIKPGMDSREIVARFEAERQALALMDHPNIAQVFDGGTTKSGHPYFVMELVKGVPITQYCDDARLGMRQRLELFLDVLAAVQHAHQKGIIHRDLKPSNILVSPHDGRPVVKVIDFGIAKALNIELTEKTLFTRHGMMVGTPEYMSPEQAEMNALDVDTRSDLYSLGVVAYELLTGRTPLDSTRLRQAGYAEIQRMIIDDEPPCPSTRLSTLGEALNRVAERRNIEPVRLARQVRGELDWIVMKALEKNRARRYETAGAFAADVRRYLADEPVEACPPSNWYRLRKSLHQNRKALAAATMVLLALVAGLIASTWQAARAMKAEAESANSRNEAIAALGVAEQQRQKAEIKSREAEVSRGEAEARAQDALAAQKAAEMQRVLAVTSGERLMIEKQKVQAEREKAGALVAHIVYELQNQFFVDRNLPLLEDLAGRVVEYYDKMPSDDRDLRSLREKTVGLNFKANVLAAKGDKNAASLLYHQVLVLRENLAKQFPEDRQFQSDIAQSCLKLLVNSAETLETNKLLLTRAVAIINQLESEGPLTNYQAEIKKDLMEQSRRLQMNQSPEAKSNRSSDPVAKKAGVK